MFTYITTDPNILGGKPIIKGTRLSVEFLLELFASGATHNQILAAYPQLSPDAVAEALHYAAQALKNDFMFEVAA